MFLYFKDDEGILRIVEIEKPMEDVCNPRYLKQKVKSDLAIIVQGAILTTIQ